LLLVKVTALASGKSVVIAHSHSLGMMFENAVSTQNDRLSTMLAHGSMNAKKALQAKCLTESAVPNQLVSYLLVHEPAGPKATLD